jgi:diguanylate cyclase (GGDEF)-like protein
MAGSLSLRLTDRRDRLLLAGLAIALITAFDHTIAYLLALAADVESSYGVRLVPALVVLTVIFIVHQHSKRLEMKVEAARVAREAIVVRERAEELERLSGFGHALAGALTVDAIQAALWRHLPSFIGERESWVAMWNRGQCHILVNTAQPGAEGGHVDDLVLRAIGALAAAPGERQLMEGPYCCVPLVTGDTFGGAWGVSSADVALDAECKRTIQAASTMLAIALRNMQMFEDLRQTALKDALTQCFNRTHLLEVLNAELRRARRTRNSLSLVMLDLDNFKGLNDRRGHLAGDAALASVGRQLRAILRQSDVCCRFGGDEFAILLPDTGLRGAAHVAENLRAEIERLAISGGADGNITASVGVATSPTGDGDSSALVQRADHALYEAKRGGRNRVWLDDALAQAIEPPEHPSVPEAAA